MSRILICAVTTLLLAACANQPERKSNDTDTLRAKDTSQPCSTLTPMERSQRERGAGPECEESAADRAARREQQSQRNSDPFGGTLNDTLGGVSGSLPDLNLRRLPASQR